MSSATQTEVATRTTTPTKATTRITTKDIIETEPPIVRQPTKKVPPPPPPLLPPPTPDLSPLQTSRRFEKHGTASSYFLRPIQIPEMYVALPEGLAMKPSKLGTDLWEKTLKHPEGVELAEDLYQDLPGQDEYVITPYGKKKVKVITKRLKMKAGAEKVKSEQLGSNLYTKFYRGKELSPVNLGGKL